MAKAGDQVDYGIVQHVVRVIDNCITTLSLMWESGCLRSVARSPVSIQDV
jgi:hypothetical protein